MVWWISCADIDECDVFQGCGNGGSCINTIGGFVCSCLAGFTGNDCQTGTSSCQTGTSSCQTGMCAVKHVRRALYSTVRHAESSPKHHDALCCFAADIDECSTTGDGQACGFGGTCIDGVNSYTCLCTPQYTGNECSLGKRKNFLLTQERQGTETMKCACDVNHNSL